MYRTLHEAMLHISLYVRRMVYTYCVACWSSVARRIEKSAERQRSAHENEVL